LHGELKETVYCKQPTRFEDSALPDHVCLLDKSVYALRQVPRAWYQRFAAHLRSLGFVTTDSDTSLFVLRCGSDTAWLLLYVDDIVLTASSNALLQQIVHDLRSAFVVKDLGPLHYFLSIQAPCTPQGFFLHQQQYVEEILERAGMLNCKPATTLVDTKAKVSTVEGTPLTDKTLYRRRAAVTNGYKTGAGVRCAASVLTYARSARHSLDLHQEDPTVRSRDHKPWHSPSSFHVHGTDRVHGRGLGWMPRHQALNFWFLCFPWGRTSFLSSKRQAVVSRSSAEAEYRCVTNAAAECCWLRNLLCELQESVHKASIIFCDNVSAVYLSDNPVHHKRTKHVELDIHFVRECTTLLQFVDIMTNHISTRELSFEFYMFLLICSS
jgi:hypothetical protein